jgi:hypothetical protein
MLKRMPGIIAWTENWYRLGMFRTLLVWTLLPLFVLLLVIVITPPLVLSLGLLRWPLVGGKYLRGPESLGEQPGAIQEGGA